MINKSVRILTFHSVKNYGALLQAFALYSYLKEIYIDVRIIDYRPQNITFKPTIKNPLSYIYWWKFSSFKKRMNYTKTVDIDDLKNIKADIFIVGSDQVWNPDITQENQGIYLLNFVNEKNKKVSFAASFGKSELRTEEKYIFKKYLKDFKSISVREDEGYNICASLGINSTVLLDPTFLIKDYSKYFKIGKKKNELSIFSLAKLSQDLIGIAQYISKKENLKAKIINKNKPVKGFRIIPFPSVECFIYEMSISDIVITDSFHGVVFSILLRSQFFYICSDINKISRVRTLLSKLDLQDRIFYNCKDVICRYSDIKNIDYFNIEEKIDKLREDSYNFIKNL